MSAQKLNILRMIRIQLKTGFMTREPDAYRFLIRNPPMNRQNEDTFQVIKPRELPYVKYYKRAVQRNPVYVGDTVYPAYSQHDPIAMTLAKKQYEFIKAGMSEDEAYEKAKRFVEEIESKSYEEMQQLQEKLAANDATLSFTSKPEIVSQIERWRGVLLVTEYANLTPAEQGEVDYFLHTSILKWNEVDRARRMKDPLFVVQMEKLRKALFLRDVEVPAPSKRSLRDVGYRLMGLSGINSRATKYPFLYEDYYKLFQKLKQQPYLSRWPMPERTMFGKWMLQTLIPVGDLKGKSREQTLVVVDEVRSRFFPMIRFPNLVAQFNIPTVSEVRQVLYDNDIGYKTVRDALYVRRFYRLPLIFFPKDTLASLLSMDHNKLRSLLAEEDGVSSVLIKAGLDLSYEPSLRASLNDIIESTQVPVYRNGNSDSSIDMSILDDLLFDSTDVAEPVVKEVVPEPEPEASEKPRHPDYDNWVKKYIPSRDTVLGEERDKFFSKGEPVHWMEAETEAEFKLFSLQRKESEVIARAQCTKEFEKREAARRVKDWKSRGVWSQEMLPRPMPRLE